MDIQGRQCQRIPTDSAAEVGDATKASPRESPGVMGGNRETRGLLETRGSKEHRVSEVAKLGARLVAQAGLADDGSDECGIVAVFP